MAEIYESEKEQVEALKRWWKENGKTVIVGLAVGLGAVLGWTSWQDYQRRQAEAASSIFQAQVDAIGEARYDEADAFGMQLLTDYDSSGYAPMGALLLSKSAFEQGKLDEARRHLQWILDNTDRPEMLLTARMRLAKLAISAADPEGALALLDVPEPGEFTSMFDELKGDAYVAQSRPDEAREAYESALSNMPEASPLRRRVQLKLDDLGHLNVPAS